MVGPVWSCLPSLAVAVALQAAPTAAHGPRGASAPEVLPVRLPPAVQPAPKNTHRADLLVPSAEQDHSAFRYDSEVFGWNNDFTEVASVSMEVVRGPMGRHRGEAFMLVYPVGSWLPKYNIICHNITHVDLPDNPVPMEQAEDYLWVIETSYQKMWPNRPVRRPKRGFMRVTPLTAFLPEDFKLPAPPPEPPAAPHGDAPALVKAARAQKAAEVRAERAPLLREAPGVALQNSEARCRPWVGFVLDWHGRRRLQPFVPLDMGARCGVLRRGEAARTYWGRPDVAASMVRVDFAARETNEESGRFVASAAWALGRTPRLEVQGLALSLSQRRQLADAVREMGGHLLMRPKVGAGGAATPMRVRGPRAWLAWGAMLAEAARLPVARYVVDELQPDVLRWEPAGPHDAEAPATWTAPLPGANGVGGAAGSAPGATAPDRGGAEVPGADATGTPADDVPRPTGPASGRLPPAPPDASLVTEPDGADVPPSAQEPAPSPMPSQGRPPPEAQKPLRGRYIENWKP